MSNSMLDAQSSASVAVRALMSEHLTLNNAVIFVEGPTDLILFSKFISHQHVKMEISGGKLKAIEALRYYLQNKNNKLAIAIIDADYDHALKITYPEKEIFLSDHNDMLSQIISCETLRVVLNITNNGKLDPHKVRDYMYAAVNNLAYLRIVNTKFNLEIDFASIGKMLIDKSEDETINLIFTCNKCSKTTACNLKSLLIAERKNNYPVPYLNQGHDLCHALSIYLQNNGNSANTSSEKLETFLISSYDSHDFKLSDLFKKISVWANDNQVQVFRI